MIKAVIDTNVLVSALLTHDNNAPTKRVLAALLSGEFISLLNEQIVDEYIDVLNREKFNFDKEEVSLLIEHIKRVSKTISPCHANETFPDPDDQVFYEVALAESDAKLVTGNLKHYPISPIVVTPAQFCELLAVKA